MTQTTPAPGPYLLAAQNWDQPVEGVGRVPRVRGDMVMLTAGQAKHLVRYGVVVPLGEALPERAPNVAEVGMAGALAAQEDGVAELAAQDARSTELWRTMRGMGQAAEVLAAQAETNAAALAAGREALRRAEPTEQDQQ